MTAKGSETISRKAKVEALMSALSYAEEIANQLRAVDIAIALRELIEDTQARRGIPRERCSCNPEVGNGGSSDWCDGCDRPKGLRTLAVTQEKAPPKRG